MLRVTEGLGISPLRDLYDPRHTYATFALRAGVPVFAVSRFMGTSIAMIDLHYGHLAVDSFEHAVSLLDALAVERAVDAGVDAGTETGETAPLQAFPASPRAVAADGGRWVDVEAGYRRDDRGQSRLNSSHFAEPSVGLEPTTPSLPWRCSTD